MAPQLLPDRKAVRTELPPPHPEKLLRLAVPELESESQFLTRRKWSGRGRTALGRDGGSSDFVASRRLLGDTSCGQRENRSPLGPRPFPIPLEIGLDLEQASQFPTQLA